MSMTAFAGEGEHSHVFLGEAHAANERRTWLVIALCGVMMAAEIVGGVLFGSIALVADGLHMSTHAGALLLAALAYRYARRHAQSDAFAFGTGKLGDLAGFTSAIILAMIAVLIAYEAALRLLHPIAINFGEAIPIAVVGLCVNIASVWLLGGDHHHSHGHAHGASDDHEHGHHGHGGHGHGHGGHAPHSDAVSLATPWGEVELSIFEDGVPPRFRLRFAPGAPPHPRSAPRLETERPGGLRDVFTLEDRGGYFESKEEIPEPHAFIAHLQVEGSKTQAVFAEPGDHDHRHEGHGAHVDNNMRAALVHVVADAAVSVLVIVGLIMARILGWVWMDPLAGLIGAGVIASWSYGLIRDTGAILLDVTPNQSLRERMRQTIEADGDVVSDLHLWRIGPGHLGAIVSVATASERTPLDYRRRLQTLPAMSHVTIEVTRTHR